jgi:hypothetical protein
MGRLLAVRTPAWANHVEGLLAYTAAVVGNDQNAKTVATQNLDGFAERLAPYFSDIVNNDLAADPLAKAITAHDQHLIDHLDAYAAKRYDQAQELELEGYQQMLDVANMLVSAIQRTVRPSCRSGGLPDRGRRDRAAATMRGWVGRPPASPRRRAGRLLGGGRTAPTGPGGRFPDDAGDIRRRRRCSRLPLDNSYQSSGGGLRPSGRR